MLQYGLWYTVIGPALAGKGWISTFVYFVIVFGVLLGSYLLGSINTSILVSKCFYKKDIRKFGSGNAGLTNMFRTFGAKAALCTLVGDILKTVISILVSALFFGFYYSWGISMKFMPYFAGLFAVLGHIFPVFYRFKGGKGVLSTAAMVVVLAPLCFVVLFLLFVIIVSISKYVSLGSCCAAFLFPLTIYFQQLLFHGASDPGCLVAAMILAVLVIWCHRGNLKRIYEGNERKLSFGSKRKAAAEAEMTESSSENNEE
ncbi:MAG: glycerol-3-phosphate 1-O-acyltransferase PlsY [Clostridia bacterium]|nr:glycerol-3-phosphate 1-O-acyltransferase PlsY [Clostridia bacterium]